MSQIHKWNDLFSISADPKIAISYFSIFEESYQRSTGKIFSPNTKRAKILFRIFGNSSILTQKLINNPNWADDICNSSYLNKRKPIKKIVSDITTVLKDMDKTDTDTLKTSLRLYKYKEMIRIVARDIACEVCVRDTLEEWSDIAGIILNTAYEHFFSKLTAKHGEHCPGTILALGKLGAGELNLSSDVDLIFIYEFDSGAAVEVSNHEFHEELVVNITRFLSDVTHDGFLYRVDHELRPEGKQGPLANSLDAAERYYQYFGQDWERQTLIRARPIAGDLVLGEKFLNCITHFIYRRSVSLEDLSQMREMKLRMEKEASLKHDSYNIKLGPGGIREVEFFVQALQQFYGGKYPKVRCKNTYDAIEKLRKESLIHPHTAKSLTEAYSFLRKTENMLQADEDLQIHRIPHKKESLAALGRRMGFLNVDEFIDELGDHTGQVERSFHALFEADYELQELEEAIRGNLESCSDDEERADSLAWFRSQEMKRIQHLEVNDKISLQTALRRLTRVADVIIKCAWSLSVEELEKRYGTPQMQDGSVTGFTIVGMGRLGSLEMDYGSDLDLIFLYSGNGETDGKRSISNAEFYTKLAQRIISLISLSISAIAFCISAF